MSKEVKKSKVKKAIQKTSLGQLHPEVKQAIITLNTRERKKNFSSISYHDKISSIFSHIEFCVFDTEMLLILARQKQEDEQRNRY